MMTALFPSTTTNTNYTRCLREEFRSVNVLSTRDTAGPAIKGSRAPSVTDVAFDSRSPSSFTRVTASPKLRTARASQRETMLARYPIFRAHETGNRSPSRAERKRHGRPEISRGFNPGDEFHGAARRAEIVFPRATSRPPRPREGAGASRRHTAYGARSGTHGTQTLAFRSCGDVFHGDLTKRNVSSSATISGVKLARDAGRGRR